MSMTKKWVWYNIFDIKLKTVMDFEPSMNYTKWLISKTFAWDLTEMIAHKVAYECLMKGYYDVQRCGKTK